MKDSIVLIAESREIDAAYMSLMLKLSGYQAEVAKNGDEALNRLSEKQYSLIFVNDLFSAGDGAELVRQIRTGENSKNAQTPIVGITEASLEMGRRRFETAGTNFCISKPVYRQSLVDILTAVC